MCAKQALYGGYQRENRTDFQDGGKREILHHQPRSPVWQDHDYQQIEKTVAGRLYLCKHQFSVFLG